MTALVPSQLITLSGEKVAEASAQTSLDSQGTSAARPSLLENGHAIAHTMQHKELKSRLDPVTLIVLRDWDMSCCVSAKRVSRPRPLA